MPTTTTPTTLLDTCDAEIPVGDVTRVFDFGQFIELYDPGAGPNPVPAPIVVDPVGNMQVAKFVKLSLSARGKPVADIEQGHISSASCILANLAMKLHRTLAWDAAKGQVTGDDEANRLLQRPYRSPWVHPAERL